MPGKAELSEPALTKFSRQPPMVQFFGYIAHAGDATSTAAERFESYIACILGRMRRATIAGLLIVCIMELRARLW